MNTHENEKFGKLTVLGISAEKNKHNHILYACECECGNTIQLTYNALISGNTKSCGCLQKLNYPLDLTGIRFGRYIVLERCESIPNKPTYWKCQCNCGNIKNVQRSGLIGGRVHSCGCLQKENASKYMSNTKGDKSHNWKGGKTSESIMVRTSNKYAAWRLSVFERDGFICQKCHQHSRELEAHHLNSFYCNKEQRLDIDNGITLCKEHHREFHTLYGKRNNTKNQFMEYLN